MSKQSICYIYKIKHKKEENYPCYVGSTTDVKRRTQSHKSACHNEGCKKYNYYVYEFIRDFGGWEKWKVETLATVIVKDKKELHEIEKLFIKEHNAKLNSKIPARTSKEYKEDEPLKHFNRMTLTRLKQRENGNKARLRYYERNKEKIIESNKKYYKENKEKIDARRKEKIKCLCGCEISKREHKNHLKTQIHKDNLSSHFKVNLEIFNKNNNETII